MGLAEVEGRAFGEHDSNTRFRSNYLDGHGLRLQFPYRIFLTEDVLLLRNIPTAGR